MTVTLKQKFLNGVIWASLERFSFFSIRFIITLILARILTPKDFGLIGIISIFFELSGILIDSGFSQYLIRKQHKSEEDISTVFIFNIFLGTLLYCILFLLAPFIAVFFNEVILTEILRVYGLILIINATYIIHNTLFVASVNFKVLAKISFISSVCSGILGVYLAYKGSGVWSLVVMSFVGSIITSVMLWIVSDCRPKLIFSKKSFCEMFSFGNKLLFADIINCMYCNLYNILIGKFYSSVTLGFYTKAKQFAELPSSQISGVFSNVTYPILCTIQDDPIKLCSLYRKLTKVSCFIIFPIMSLLAGVSTPLIILIIGKKWEFTATLLIPLCFTMMFYPIHSLNLALLKVKGRSDLFLKLEIIKKTIGLILLLCSFPFGVLTMCYVGIFFSVGILFINTYYTKKLINYNIYDQLKDVFFILILSLITFGITFFICSVVSSLFLSIVIGVLAGTFFYIIFSLIYYYDEIMFLKSMLKMK